MIRVPLSNNKVLENNLLSKIIRESTKIINKSKLILEEKRHLLKFRTVKFLNNTLCQ